MVHVLLNGRLVAGVEKDGGRGKPSIRHESIVVTKALLIKARLIAWEVEMIEGLLEAVAREVGDGEGRI